MTVGAAEKMWSKDNLRLSSRDGRNRTIRIQEGYTVISDPTDKSEDVLLADGLPNLTDVYPAASQIRVVDVDPQRIGPVFWMVMVTYEGEAGPEGFGGSTDPIQTNPTIEWRNVFEEVEWDKAFDDDEEEKVVSLATANGEKVHGITERIVDFVAVIERNYAFGAFNLADLHQYLHSVSSDSITTNFGTFAAGTARLMKFEPIEAYAEEFGGYVRVHAEVQFRYPYQTTADKAWWKRYLHEGYIVRVRPAAATENTEDDRLINVLDDNDDASVRPKWLDEDGVEIPEFDGETRNDPFYREQRTLLRLPYAALGLF